MKRVIISGGNGFIGRYVVSALLQQGYECIIVDRRCIDNSSSGIKQIQSNLAGDDDITFCSKQIVSADIFVHLAADITVPGDASTMGNNIEGMRTALEIAKETGVKHFILLSSIPVIGSIKKTPITEEHSVHPQTPYHWSKYLCEKMLEQYKEYFITSVFRIPSPIGVGMRNNVFLSVVLNKLKSDEIIEVHGSGKRTQNYIDVRDIASAIAGVIDDKCEGLYLIAGQESISNISLVNVCKGILNSHSEIIVGVHPDIEEDTAWIVSTEKAYNAFGFHPQYSFNDSVCWILDNIK